MNELTPEQKYIQRLADWNPHIKIISAYEGSGKPITYQCNVCGAVRTVSQANVLFMGRECDACSRRQRGKKSRKTHEQFVQEVAMLNPDVEVLSEYQTCKSPITYRCKKCGNTYTISKASRLLDGRACRTCAAIKKGLAKRKTTAQFTKELSQVAPWITAIDEYNGSGNLILVRCNKCGHEWKTTPASLLAGHGCPECAHAAQGWLNHEMFVGKITQRFPDIKVLSEYCGTAHQVKCQCGQCGYEWTPYASVLLSDRSSGCPNCAHRVSPDEATMKQRVEEANPCIEYLDGYIDMTHYATFRCRHCGSKWNATPSNIQSGKGCPHCNMSRGEQAIAYYLDQHNLAYSPQHRFSDCCDKEPLRFDFYIPERHLCVEYDGEQHFYPVAFSGDKDTAQRDYLDLQRHDAIKDKYCLEHNITLLRIPYTEYGEIFNILSKYIP